MRPMEAAADRSKSPVFVVGYMHSGTTLMYRLLGNHPAMFSGDGETKFFEFVPALQQRFPDLSDRATLRAVVEYTVADLLAGFSLARLQGTEDATPVLAARGISTADIDAIVESCSRRRVSHGEVFRLAFEHLAARSGKSRWLEKTPTHVFHLDEIIQAVPDALFIEITRDPRDVLASKKTRRADVWRSNRYSEQQRAFKHLEKAYDPFWDALSWKSAISAGRQARTKYPARVYRVSYEQLVTDSEATIRGFCEFLALDFVPEMTDVSVATPADWNGRAQRTGIYRQSMERWKTTLSQTEIALIQLLLGRELEELGYPVVPLSLHERATALEHLLASQAHIFVRLFRRWRMGGMTLLSTVARAYTRRLRVLVRR